MTQQSNPAPSSGPTGLGRKVSILAGLAIVIAVALYARSNRQESTPDISPQPTIVTEAPALPTPESIADATEETAPIKSAPLPQLIDLGADKCVACKQMAPILDKLQEDYQDQLNVVFIDVWKFPEVAQPYNIKVIPTQIFIDPAGNEVFRHIGFFSREEILAKWKELGIELKTPRKQG